MINETEFLRYIPLGLALAVSAFFLAGERALLGDERTLFAQSLENASADARARVAATIERRRAAERMEQRPIWIGIALLLAIGVTSALRVLDAADGMALAILVYVLMAILQVGSAKRSDGGRRVAVLAERRLTDVVPIWILCVPLLSCIGGIAVMRAYAVGLPMLIAIGSSLLAVAAIPFLVRTPSIVGADDPVVDELVDGKVRASRLRQMVMTGAYAPLLVAYAAIPPHSANASMIRSIWLIALSFMLIWSNQRLRFSAEDLRKMYGL